MSKFGKGRKLLALVSTLVMLFTLLTPFTALAAENADGYEEVLRFSAFEKEYESGFVGGNIYANWSWAKDDQSATDITAGHDLKNLRLQLKFELTGPEGNAQMSSTWNKNGYLKIRSAEDNGENNYGWYFRPSSSYPMTLRAGENELLIPLVNVAGDGYETTATGKMDWTRVDRILMVVEGKDMKKDVHDHKMKITYAAIVDIGEQPEPTPSIEMPTLFANNMMFQQGKDFKVWGKAEPGENIQVILDTAEGERVFLKSGSAGDDGKWEVMMPAMEASYQKYTMTVNAIKDGEISKTKVIRDVLFGEVWVAAGQSNMALPVRDELYATQYAEEAATTEKNEYIRMFWEPNTPYGDAEQPFDPQEDVPGAYWGKGNHDGDVLSVSAVGYHFAKKMQQELDIPVGILYTPVGGSVIEAWIPKDAIDADAEYKAFLQSKNKYCDENNWPTGWNRMSALYNQKISALKGYNVAGTIWYQGCSNVDEGDMYGHALTLLRDSWNDVFGFETGENDMPFIFTSLEPWVDTQKKGPQHLAIFTEGMYDGWAENEYRNMAMINIYDQPLFFLDGNGNSHDPIHPTVKIGVGERFATAAYNMRYANPTTEYTAPVYKSHVAVDTDEDGINDAIDVTFDHVGDCLGVINRLYEDDELGINKGDGLTSFTDTDDLHGFAIAGTGGVYVDAKAKITGKDTVRVWSEGLKNPVNVTYNFYSYYTGGTLKNSVDIPATPFRSDRVGSATYFNAQDWKYADSNVWVPYTNNLNGNNLNWVDFLPAWENAPIEGGEGTITYDGEVKAEGRASIKYTYTPDKNGNAGLGPVMGYLNVTNQFQNFDTISVQVKNPDAVSKMLSLAIQSGDAIYLAYPVVDGEVGETMPAAKVKGSSDFTTYTFSLRHLLGEDNTVLTETDTVLSNVDALEFLISGQNAGTIYLDDVTFGFLYDANVDTSALEREFAWSTHTGLIDPNMYTQDSLAAYTAVMDQAAAVLDDPVATQSQIDRMAAAVKEARLNLKETTSAMTFSKFERPMSVGDNNQQNLYMDWTLGDVAPTDLSENIENKYLYLSFTLIRPDDVTDSVFNSFGWIKLRSTDDNGENNYGWQWNAQNNFGFKAGKNEIMLPLKDGDTMGGKCTITRTGTMDWTRVDRILLAMSDGKMSGRTGEFTIIMEEARVVDTTQIAALKASLQSFMGVTPTGTDATAKAAYDRALVQAQAILDDETATLTQINRAGVNLFCALNVLNGTATFNMADKAALVAEIATKPAKEQKKYDQKSWFAYEEALAQAEAVNARDYAYQIEVDDAVDTLKAARNSLVLLPGANTTELEALIKECEESDLSGYTPASVKFYTDSVATGKNLLDTDPSQAQVDNAVKAIKEGKSMLTEQLTTDDPSITLSFPKSNVTTNTLLGGRQFYINWQQGEGLTNDNTLGGGVNMSGTAANGANKNLALYLDVQFADLQNAGIDLSACWTNLYVRLRSSRLSSAEKAAKLVQIKPTDVTIENGAFSVMVPLSDMVTENINWGDVKELNIWFEVPAEYQLAGNGNSDKLQVTLSNVKIAAIPGAENPPAPVVDKTALNTAITAAEAITDLSGYTAESAKAFTDALAAAKAVANKADATQTEVDNAKKALTDAQTGLTEKEPAPIVNYGDVNGNGSVTAEDALLALQIATNKVTPSDAQKAAADVDGNGDVTANDALLILQFATKKINSFPVEQ